MHVILALALSVLALGWGVPTATAQEAYKVGAIFSITGPAPRSASPSATRRS